MEFLSQNGVEFEAKDVSAEEDARDELIKLGSQSTPTILVDDKIMVGFRGDELLKMIKE